MADNTDNEPKSFFEKISDTASHLVDKVKDTIGIGHDDNKDHADLGENRMEKDNSDLPHMAQKEDQGDKTANFPSTNEVQNQRVLDKSEIPKSTTVKEKDLLKMNDDERGISDILQDQSDRIREMQTDHMTAAKDWKDRIMNRDEDNKKHAGEREVDNTRELSKDEIPKGSKADIDQGLKMTDNKGEPRGGITEKLSDLSHRVVEKVEEGKTAALDWKDRIMGNKSETKDDIKPQGNTQPDTNIKESDIIHPSDARHDEKADDSTMLGDEPIERSSTAAKAKNELESLKLVDDNSLTGMANKVISKAGDLKDSISDKAGDLKESISQRAGDLKDTISDKLPSGLTEPKSEQGVRGHPAHTWGDTKDRLLGLNNRGNSNKDRELGDRRGDVWTLDDQKGDISEERLKDDSHGGITHKIVEAKDAIVDKASDLLGRKKDDQDIDRSGRDLPSDSGSGLTDKASDLKDRATDTLSRAWEGTKQTLSDAKDTIIDKLGNSGDKLDDTKEDLKDKGRDLADKASDKARDLTDNKDTSSTLSDMKDRIVDKAGDIKDTLVDWKDKALGQEKSEKRGVSSEERSDWNINVDADKGDLSKDDKKSGSIDKGQDKFEDRPVQRDQTSQGQVDKIADSSKDNFDVAVEDYNPIQDSAKDTLENYLNEELDKDIKMPQKQAQFNPPGSGQEGDNLQWRQASNAQQQKVNNLGGDIKTGKATDLAK